MKGVLRMRRGFRRGAAGCVVALMALVARAGEATPGVERTEVLTGAVSRVRMLVPDHAWVWRRSGPCGDAPFDGKTIELHHQDEADWSLNCFRPLAVKTGDRFVFSCVSHALSGTKGTLQPSVVTRRADGSVVDWVYASVPVAAGEAGRTEFIIPPGVTSIEPRFVGSGPIDVRLSEVRVEQYPTVMRGDAPSEPHTLTSERLVLSVSPTDGAVSVTDRRTGRVWRPSDKEGQSPCLVTGMRDLTTGTGASASHALEVRLVDPRSLGEMTATYRLDDNEVIVTLTGSFPLAAPIDYPSGFAAQKGDWLIVPMNEGIGFPVEENPPGIWREGMNSGHGLCMAFFGVTETASGAGWMALVETPDDAAMVVRPDRSGLLAPSLSWEPSCGGFGDARTMRYVFFPSGGHVAMAKRYRAYAKEKGLLVTFPEKAKRRPRVMDLCGAPNLWVTDGSDAQNVAVVDALRAAGWSNLLWSAGGSPACVKRLAGLPGVLVGRYDIYQDIMDPAKREEVRGWHPDWIPEAYPQDIMWSGPSPEQWTRGWPVDAKKGPRIPCAVLCDSQAPKYARERIGEELKRKPYTARFIDTTTATPWRECYNPAHPMTRGESRVWKTKLLAVVSEEYGLVCGSETGHDAVVPVCDYFEGMLSLGPYRIDEAGRDMWRTVEEVPDRVRRYQVGEKYRLPLWELVYHDCCVAQWYWGDYNNKLPAIWRKRDLFNALYGTPPMYFLHISRWEELKPQILESLKTACPIARATAGVEMVDHRILSDDRAIQETVFANGVTVRVDFNTGKVTGLPARF